MFHDMVLFIVLNMCNFLIICLMILGVFILDHIIYASRKVINCIMCCVLFPISPLLELSSVHIPVPHGELIVPVSTDGIILYLT